MIINEMIGMVFVDVQKTDNSILFFRHNAPTIEMKHIQDCCEEVYIESITGDLKDLVGTPILHAEESSNSNETQDGSETWTFYKFRTIKGYVDIRWYGESNGYYSEEVYLYILDN